MDHLTLSHHTVLASYVHGVVADPGDMCDIGFGLRSSLQGLHNQGDPVSC